jgi:hypothetical protein
LSSQLREFDLIVTPGSTVALEARFLNVPVLLFRPAVVLDAMDLANLVPDSFFEYASGVEMRDKVLGLLRESPDSDPSADGLRDGLFAPVDEREWLECLSDRRTK